MKKLIILIIACLGFTNCYCQLLGKSKEQILKINYSKPRKLISLNESSIVFNQGNVDYFYYFNEEDTCFMQALHMPYNMLDQTVKDYTEKYKLAGPMSWVDRNGKYLYTIVTDMSFAGKSPDGRKYFAVKIRDYETVYEEQMADEAAELDE